LAEKGYFPKEEIKQLRQAGSMLQGHPDSKSTPGVDASAGSLGQGISIAVGMAIAAKKLGKSYRIYTILGDGEIQEGQVWEAAMCAAHYKLDNLTAFVDCNGMQIDGYIKDVLSPLPIDEKFKAFGWKVVHCDGHDLNQLDDAIKMAQAALLQPTLVLMHTIKGKGVSYMENNLAWHGMAPNQEQYRQALAELDQRIEEWERELA
jgi:transketolase